MDISEKQRDAIVAWANAEPYVVAVWLFGSRAKGTSRTDSDADVALEFSMPDEAVTTYFENNGDLFQHDLRLATGIEVNVHHLAGKLTPVHFKYVRDGGILLYRKNPQ